MSRALAPLFSFLLASSCLAACGPCAPAEARTFDLTKNAIKCTADDEGVALTGNPLQGGALTDGGTGAPVCSCQVYCKKITGETPESCRYLSATMLECVSSQSCPGGRKPAHLVAPRLPFTDRRTAFLLGCAHMEAASVIAFEQLACEMSSLGAPALLLYRLHAAAADEVRHARDMLALAGDHALPLVDAPSPGLRGAHAIALENAREGCVRETFAALIAHRQALTARDPAVRSVMAGIAADETRHAELSWDLAAWLEDRLDVDQRAAIVEARAKEASALRSELAAGGLGEDADLGLPGATEAMALLDGLFAGLAREAA